MPTYDYRCETNDRVIEVSHRMSENLSNWGELCACAGIETGDTPSESPVHRLATGGNIIHSLGSGSSCSTGSCATGSSSPCCGGGFCGLN